MLHGFEERLLGQSERELQEPESLPLEEVVRACEHEMQEYRSRHITTDVFRLELFRRAIVGQDQEAWQAIYFLYNRLVCSWVCQSARGASWLSEEEAAELANVVFAKFSRAVTPAKLVNFASIGALLHYFKVIVGCVVADERADRDRREETSGLLTLPDQGTEDLATIVVANDEARTLLQDIFACLRTEHERLYVWMTYICGMKPQHIVAHNGELFPTVSEVYRTHANVRDKLRNYQRRMQSGRGKRSAPYLTERGTDESTS